MIRLSGGNQFEDSKLVRVMANFQKGKQNSDYEEQTGDEKKVRR